MFGIISISYCSELYIYPTSLLIHCGENYSLIVVYDVSILHITVRDKKWPNDGEGWIIYKVYYYKAIDRSIWNWPS